MQHEIQPVNYHLMFKDSWGEYCISHENKHTYRGLWQKPDFTGVQINGEQINKSQAHMYFLATDDKVRFATFGQERIDFKSLSGLVVSAKPFSEEEIKRPTGYSKAHIGHLATQKEGVIINLKTSELFFPYQLWTHQISPTLLQLVGKRK